MSIRRRRILFFSVVKRPAETPPDDGDAILTEAGDAITTETDENLDLE